MKFGIVLCLCVVVGMSSAQYVGEEEEAFVQTPLFRQEQERIQVEDDSLISAGDEQSRQVRQAYESINVDIVNGWFST